MYWALVLILLFLFPLSSQAAIVHKQTVAAGNVCSAVNTCTCTFGSNTTAGSLLLAYARVSATGRTVTVSDTQLNTWGASPDITATDATDVGAATITSAMNTAGGADVVTVTVSGAATNMRVSCSEYSGVATSSALDKTNHGDTGSGTSPASGAVVPTTDGQLIFAIMGNATGSTVTAGTDFTIRAQVPATTTRLASEDYIQPTAASHDGTFSLSVTSTWMAAVATYKAATAAVASGIKIGSLKSTGGIKLGY